MVWRLTGRGPWFLVRGRGTIIRGFLTTCSSRVGVGSGFQSRGPFTTDRGRVGSGVNGPWTRSGAAAVRELSCRPTNAVISFPQRAMSIQLLGSLRDSGFSTNLTV